MESIVNRSSIAAQLPLISIAVPNQLPMSAHCRRSTKLDRVYMFRLVIHEYAQSINNYFSDGDVYTC